MPVLTAALARAEAQAKTWHASAPSPSSGAGSKLRSTAVPSSVERTGANQYARSREGPAYA